MSKPGLKAGVTVLAVLMFASLAGAVPFPSHLPRKPQLLADPQPRQPAEPAPSSQATLRLASQAQWIGPGEPFVMRLQVAGADRLDGAKLAVSIHQQVSTRSQFTLTLSGNQLGNVIGGSTTPIARLSPPDASGALTLTLTARVLGIRRTGVYPVEVALRGRTGDLLDRFVTHIVFVQSAPRGPKLGLSWVLPVDAPPSFAPDGTVVAPEGQGLDVLGDVVARASPGAQLVLAPTPETLDGLAVTAEANKDSRRALDALRKAAAGVKVLARPYTPVDVASLLGRDLRQEADAQRAAGAFVTASVLGAPTQPRLWLAEEGLSEATVAYLRDNQLDRLIVSEASLVPVELPVTLAQPFQLRAKPGTSVEAVVADDGLSTHFRDQKDPVLAAQQFLADLAVIWLDAPQKVRSVVAATPSSWMPSRAFLDAALDGLTRSPLVAPVSLDTVFDAVPLATAATNRPIVRRVANPRTLTNFPTDEIRAARKRLDTFATSLPASSDTYHQLQRPLLLAESAEVDSQSRQSYLAAFQAGMSRQVGQLVLPRAGTLTLTAREGAIPLTLLNLSKVPLTVVVRLQSDKLEFPQHNSALVQLPPRSTTVRFPVRARTAGAFPLRVTLLTANDVMVLATTRLTVRSTAASGVGIALSVGAALFLLVWWSRQFLRGRRSRRAADGAPG